MLKMADACQRAGGQQTRFHEMHVQRHNNVTILYADIVNFTPLSEQLTASDLVKTLNELFGRFDQIAQVSFAPNITTSSSPTTTKMSKHIVLYLERAKGCNEKLSLLIPGKPMLAYQNSRRLLLLCQWIANIEAPACCQLRQHGPSND